MLVAKVGLRDGLTPYTRFGWLPGPACTVLAAGLLVLTSVLARRKRAEHP